MTLSLANASDPLLGKIVSSPSSTLMIAAFGEANKVTVLEEYGRSMLPPSAGKHGRHCAFRVGRAFQSMLASCTCTTQDCDTELLLLPITWSCCTVATQQPSAQVLTMSVVKAESDKRKNDHDLYGRPTPEQYVPCRTWSSALYANIGYPECVVCGSSCIAGWHKHARCAGIMVMVTPSHTGLLTCDIWAAMPLMLSTRSATSFCL